jgi:hypothetical protein
MNIIIQFANVISVYDGHNRCALGLFPADAVFSGTCTSLARYLERARYTMSIYLSLS